MLCKKFYNLVYVTTNTLYKSKQMSCDNSVDLRLQTLHDWVKLPIIKIILLILGNVSNFSDCWLLKVDKSGLNILQKKIVSYFKKAYCWILALLKYIDRKRTLFHMINVSHLIISFAIYRVNGQNVICMWLQFEWHTTYFAHNTSMKIWKKNRNFCFWLNTEIHI